MKKIFEGKKRWISIPIAAVLLLLIGVGTYFGVNALTNQKAGGTDISGGTFSSEMEMKAPRTDYEEVKVKDLITEGNAANQMLPLKGGADEQAETLRTAILENKDEVKAGEGGTTYYLSPAGDDSKDGKSPETAVKSLGALEWLDLKSGDAVLFERGSVFRVTKAIQAVDGVTYGAYGEGDKPCIYGSPKNYADSSLWTPTKKANVWKLSLTYDDVGAIVFDHGKYVGIKMNSGLNQLTKTGDFFHNEDNDFVYLYCAEGNPGKVYKDIEFNVKGSIFMLNAGVSNVTFDNLCLKYIGEFGINGQHANNNVKITNCEMGYIGGTKISVSLRYGNAIQFWNSCEDIIVENCWIYQVFDTAITFQGSNDGALYKNISFSNNLLEYNDMDIEIWDSHESFTIENLKMDNNIMRFNAYGWGTRIEDAGFRGGGAFFVVSVDNCKMSNISVKNNIMDSPNYGAVSWNGSRNAVEASGNMLYALANRQTDRAIVRYGTADYKVSNQATLEAAFKTFDSSASVIQWITEE